MQQIDMNSDEFQAELEKTTKFVDKVYKQFGWVPNPNEEVNEGVTMGLARNKLIYGKRYCPCFMVIGETKEEQKEADNRICPCKPAIEKEIPEDGLCHCGIFGYFFFYSRLTRTYTVVSLFLLFFSLTYNHKTWAVTFSVN